MDIFNHNGNVDARSMYRELGIKTRFNGWIDEVVERCGFTEGNEFYRIFGKTSKKGGRPTVEYEFTPDAAKEACLVTRSEKSSEIRKFLINLSKRRDSGGLLSSDEGFNHFRIHHL